ncbi:MAG: hypothetical protein L0G99_17790 [Propionibacteriales bacterium]|nr:hypothetical protein [Propionibacteriales bacterium]
MVVHAVDLALLRTVAGWAAGSAARALPIYEAAAPGDDRPRTAVEAIRTFADGGPRVHRLRVWSMGAHRAAMAASDPAAAAAARSASLAASSAYLHLDLLPTGHQHPHLLGAAAYASLAVADEVDTALTQAPDVVRDLVRQMPELAPGRTTLSERYAKLDAGLR